MQNKYITISEKAGERKLAYTEFGDPDNDKLLLCVHGLSRNGRDFDYIAKALASDYRVISVDVVGRGKSDWLANQSQYNYTTYIADMIYLLDKLGINKLDWLGTSMGGIMAMAINMQRPNLINKLVINDVGPFIPGEALDRIFKYIGKNTQFNSMQDAQVALQERMSTFGVTEDEHWLHLFEHGIEEHAGGYRFTYDPAIINKFPLISRIMLNLKRPGRWGKSPDVNMWQFWQAITCPVLVVRGEFSDVLPRHIYDKMLEKDDVCGVEFASVGHAPMLLNDEQIKAVKQWL